MNTTAALVLLAACLALVVFVRLWARRSARNTSMPLAVKALMTKEEANDLLPVLVEAAEDLYVFPRLTAAQMLQRTRRIGASSEAAAQDLNELVVDYAIYTKDCELVCAVVVEHGRREAAAEASRDALLLAASVTVIKLGAGRAPESAVLRAHIQLALDQRRNKVRNAKDARPGESRLAVA